jgi:hypothetical protein
VTSASPSTRPRNFTTWADYQIRRLRTFVEEVGGATVLAGRTLRTTFTTRFDTAEFIYQLEVLGVRSTAIAAATAIFVGIVMTIQFAVSMEAFGAKDTLGRVIAVSGRRSNPQARRASPHSLHRHHASDHLHCIHLGDDQLDAGRRAVVRNSHGVLFLHGTRLSSDQ